MEKFSVKKPYTILVAVIMVLVLGVVSVMNMTTDLLPSISLPYLMVITTYPGASPERVEATVSAPMEAALGTVSGVANVFSVSAENYSMTQLEFEDGTDMDSAMVKVSSTVEQVRAQLPDGVGTPGIMELSLDMIATMYVAVGYEGYDIYELSDYVKNDLIRRVERVDGVASVTGVGLVEKTILVELDDYKIDRLNDRILSRTTKGLEEAGQQLDEYIAQVEAGERELEKQQSSFGDQVAGGLTSQMEEPLQEVTLKAKQGMVDLILEIEDLEEQLRELEERMEKSESRTDVYRQAFADAGDSFRQGIILAVMDIKTALQGLQEARAKMTEAFRNLQSAFEQVRKGGTSSQKDLEAAVKILRDAIKDAQENADGYEAALNAVTDAVRSLLGKIGEMELPEDADREALEESLNLLLGYLEETGETLAGIMREVAEQAGQEAEEISEELQEKITQFIEELEQSGSVETALKSLIESDPFIAKIRNAVNTMSGTAESATSKIKKAISQLAGLREIFQQIASNMNGQSSQLFAAGIARIAEILPAIRADIESIAEEISKNTPKEADIEQAIQQIKYQIALIYQKADDIPELTVPAGNAIAMLTQGQLDAAVGFSQADTQLAQYKAQLAQAREQYNSIRSQALKNANLDSLISAQTLSQLIYAQNFAMPAGYIDDAQDNTWLLKVGEEYGSPEDIETALLADVDGIGVIRLTDVANVTVIDNADESYTKLNGNDSVVLAVFKGSTAGTNMVSRGVAAAFEEMTGEDPNLNIVNLMDQGSYITLIVRDLLSSMLLGALLAIIVLALFLRDVRPTLMVGISIPLSVLFTLVLMYFTDLSLNIMTLSGLSLGIGMLVDNSIVVMENIMRLRQRGITSARASVQGARQVSNSIVASTLTTICVFLPMVFTNGTVRELLLPMALSITYCLTASLIVAMTVVPSSASVILRRIKQPKEGFFTRLLDRYGRLLDRALDHKLIPIAFAAGLLALCVIRLIQMGIVVLPEMAGDNIQLSVETPEKTDRLIAYAQADEVMKRVMSVEGVKDVGIMDQGSTAGLVSSLAGGGGQIGSYIGYITVEEGLGTGDIERLVADIQEATKDLESEVSVSASMMGDLSGFMSSGLTVNVYGQDLDKLGEIAGDVSRMVISTEGFENIAAGTDEQEASLHLIIDKDKAMQYGLTVAQIYMQIAGKLTTEVSSTQVTVDGVNLNVLIRDETNIITRENLMDMEFTGQSQGQAGASGMGGMSGMSLGSGGGMGGMSGSMGGGMSGMSGGMSGMGLGSGGGMGGMSGMSGMSGGMSLSGDSASSSDMTGLMSMFGMASEEESAAGTGNGADGSSQAGGAAQEGDSVGADGTDSGDGAGNGGNGADSTGSGSAGSGQGAEVHKLSEFATIEETTAPASIRRENMVRYTTVTADTKEGFNTTLLSRGLSTQLEEYNRTLPGGYSASLGGETTQVNDMIRQMSLLLLLALIFIYLVMVAQFQSLLSPFIILFTVPLAFTGGMIGLIISGEQLSMLSLMGFLVLMGTVVNNGIVFVDYTNQLRIGGVDRRTALIATGKTRMRPILMTTMTTVLAMVQMIFGDGMGAQMGRGMAIVIVGGLIYSTLMTLFIVPVMYDILFKKPPLSVDVGDDLDDMPDDAAELISRMEEEEYYRNEPVYEEEQSAGGQYTDGRYTDGQDEIGLPGRSGIYDQTDLPDLPYIFDQPGAAGMPDTPDDTDLTDPDENIEFYDL